MKLTWFGHSAFRIDTGTARILIDPFFEGNPSFRDELREEAIDGLTHIALTHGHFDHLGDTVAVAKETGATVIANFDLAQYLGSEGVEKVDPGNTGGTVHHEGFSCTWVQAVHSSAYLDKNGVSHDLGDPNGLVFHLENGRTVYHMGDTDVFGDMALVQELHRPHVGLVPIGDRFTMGGAVAALACRRYFDFDTIVPCHYGSFPIIDQDASKFLDAMEGDAGRVRVAEVGQPLDLNAPAS